MYAQVLGHAFTDLAPVLKHLRGSRHCRFTGILTIRTGAHPLARLSLWLARLPRAQGEAPCLLCLLPSKSGELWQRYIGPWKFITHQWLAGNPGAHESKKEIRERFGAITLRLRLGIKGQGLRIRSVETRILGIPVPRSFGIRVVAYEKPAGNDSFYCNVRAYMPGLGMLLQYDGTLFPASAKTAYRRMTC